MPGGCIYMPLGQISKSCGNGDIIVMIMNLWNCRFSVKTATSLCFCGKENDVCMGSVSHSLLMLIAGGTASLVLAGGSARAAPRAQADLVEFEKMTWVEVKSALAAGKTTALIYTGGVEERGPQDANGGHNLMAHATVEAIARELGNAIFMPVLPYTPN